MLVAAFITGIVIACRKFALHRKIVAMFTACLLFVFDSTSYADSEGPQNGLESV